MSKKKILTILSVIFLLATIVFLFVNIHRKNVAIENLNAENSKLKEELADTMSKKVGILHMIPKYVEDINTILDDLSPNLPILKNYNNENEKKYLEKAEQWLEENKNNPQILLPDEVIISMGAVTKTNDNNYCIHLLVYRKHDINEINEGEWPYPITIGNLKQMLMIVSNDLQSWKVIDFIRSM